MKKVLYIILIVLALGVAGYFLFSGKDRSSELASEESIVNDLPAMHITLHDGARQNVKNFRGKVILIFFQPDCDHCQREATGIHKHMGAFSKYTIYFISPEEFTTMDQFAVDYGLKGQPNIQFAKTTVDDITKNLGHISAPSMYIYNDGKLVKHFDGETAIEEILKKI